MKLFSLAFRSLLRNRRRSLMTLSAMVVGLAAMLIFGGYARNAVLATQTGYVQFQGHLQIQRKGYFLYGTGNPSAYGISRYQDIIKAIQSDPLLQPMIKVITPTLQLQGIAGNFASGVSKGVVATGVDAKDQNLMRKWDDYDGQIFAPTIALEGKPADSAVVGTGVAHLLQLCTALQLSDCPSAQDVGGETQRKPQGPDAPTDIAALSALAQEGNQSAPAGGTRIELLAASTSGAPNVGSLNVVQAENWGVKEINDSLIVLNMEQAQRLVFGSAEPQVTAIQIQLAHTAQIPVATEKLKQVLTSQFGDMSLEVLDYETLTPIYRQVIQFFDSIFGFISILIYVIVLFTVGNTMSMAVVERTTEIGTLRAIGQRRSGIRRLFICEGFLLGVIGAVLGILVALPISYLINNSGLTWAPPGYSYQYPIMVRVWGDIGLITSTAFSLVLIAVLSAWWPANRAAKLNIVDALRHA